MKSPKLLLACVAAVLFGTAAGWLAIAQNIRPQSQGPWRDFIDSAAVEPETDAPEMFPQEARMPVLNIGGKEDPDVYLQSLDIQVEITGNIASTRYTMVFKNKTNRVLEGELTFPLPDGRSATHYALDIDGRMREAVPVEKARAAQVFEEIQRRQIDPGILERVEGNNFRTRIYPIPARGTRTISIGYEEELALEKEMLRYRLPMAYPAPLEKFAVKATVWNIDKKPVVPSDENDIRFDASGKSYVASLSRQNYRPARALTFALPAPAEIPQVMMQPAQGSFYFLASVAPEMSTRKKQWDDNLAIIWDVSLSGSQRNLQQEMAALNTIFADKKNVNVHLYFLNNQFKKIANKNTRNGEYRVVNGNWDGLRNILKAAVFDGGTDFSQIDLNRITGNEILFFSDGISTLSDADFLKNSNINRPIHCIVSSAKSDYSVMRLTAGKTKGKFVNINALSSAKLKGELLNETPQFLGTESGKSVREIYPSIATPVHGNFSIAGISDWSGTELTLLFGFGDKVEKSVRVKLDANRADSRGNIYKIWAQKKIAELDLEYEKNRDELTGLGAQFGIVTRNTSLMVLELISDYVRYNIEPPASEPELLAQYQRHKTRERTWNREPAQRNMLNEALASVATVKTWWNTDFTPPRPKYPAPDNNQPAKKQLTPAKNSGAFGSQGGGDPSATIIKEGALGIVSGLSNGNSSAGDDILGNGGFASDIDAVLSGMGGLRSGGDGGVGRKGVAGIGYGSGYASGFGGSGGGTGDVLGGLLGSSGGPGGSKARGEIKSGPVITLKPIRKDTDYLKMLTGRSADDYQIYLKARGDYANSPAYYFDMADWFYKLGERETALRVLTSIAELELEDASLYRMLGYRLKEYKEHGLQKFVCFKVIQWRPIEPQSYRDYALALADNGEAQAALDSLYGVITRSYPANTVWRSRGIEEVVVTEMNNLIAKNPKLDISKIDGRLIQRTPVDIRVVMNWNKDNTIIDMYVKDPNGEDCYYANQRTKIGGRISHDNVSGYGPEQFLLKKAVKGKYRVYVNYYSSREFAAAGPTTVMAEIYTKYADNTEQRQAVSLQLSAANKSGDKKIEVAEFEF